jgi:hypothetical protein
MWGKTLRSQKTVPVAVPCIHGIVRKVEEGKRLEKLWLFRSPTER